MRRRFSIDRRNSPSKVSETIAPLSSTEAWPETRIRSPTTTAGLTGREDLGMFPPVMYWTNGVLKAVHSIEAGQESTAQWVRFRELPPAFALRQLYEHAVSFLEKPAHVASQKADLDQLSQEHR